MKVGALHFSKLNKEWNKNRRDEQKENKQFFALLDSIN